MTQKLGHPINTPHRLSRFARNLRRVWREMDLPKNGETVVVAVSGGADSTALLLALDELLGNKKLALKIVVAHLNHGLRKTSGADAGWVKKLANELGHEVVVGKAQLSKTNGNLEQWARTKRYDFLLRTAKTKKASLVLTAHTLDDQAETVLLRLMRGSAAEGLSGTLPIRPIKAGSNVKLARPLLSWARRSETEEFCRQYGIDFRVDEMNNNEKFTRVKVRNQLLPLMQSINNNIVETLSRTAALLSEDAVALSGQAFELLRLAAGANNGETKLGSLDVKVMSQAPAAVRRRALREWLGSARGGLNRLERSHLMAVERLLTGRGGSVIELPGGLRVTRNRSFLRLYDGKSATRTAAGKRIEKGGGEL
ncbi:MAG TPA: tRNA lysidine(34) synthetase TilS [Pyrinomonadaceae bacterium]|nr:tRNA lysidine(34) synthetase TilS [Pyrinomonadaceae bacterium]